jgi:hypothetical protein
MEVIIAVLVAAIFIMLPYLRVAYKNFKKVVK